jgi:hypothetical protein
MSEPGEMYPLIFRVGDLVGNPLYHAKDCAAIGLITEVIELKNTYLYAVYWQDASLNKFHKKWDHYELVFIARSQNN